MAHLDAMGRGDGEDEGDDDDDDYDDDNNDDNEDEHRTVWGPIVRHGSRWSFCHFYYLWVNFGSTQCVTVSPGR